MPAISCAIPAPVIAEPKKTGYTCPRRVCSASSARSWAYGTPASLCTYVASSPSLWSASSSVRPAVNSASSAADAVTLAPGVPAPVTRPMAKAATLRRLAISAQHALGVRPGPVNLVHEQQGRYLQALQRAHQDPGLRLHALNGRDDEHNPVENAQHAVHLGDEVRVARRVDQVDGDVPDREGRHSGLDRDAAPPFQRQRIGLGGTSIDRAEPVNDARVVQQPLGKSRLTRVYMRQDPQVERFLRHAPHPMNRSQRPSRWT